MKQLCLVTLTLLLTVVSPAFAQVRAPNAAGISAAHEHLVITDETASTAFWSALGGMPEHIGTLHGVKFPGVYILFQTNRGRGRGAAAATADAPQAPQPAPEGSVGSVVEGIGFKVKNLRDTLAKIEALGRKPEAGATATAASVMSPENVRVLLTEDPSLATPSAGNELRMNVTNPAEAAAWYAKWFGASVVTQGQDVIAQIPGMNLRFVKVAEPAAGTRGRAVDHIGFEVANLQAFAAKLSEGGVTINTPYRPISLGFLTGITFITDPWGTYIELNEGYASAAK